MFYINVILIVSFGGYFYVKNYVRMWHNNQAILSHFWDMDSIFFLKIKLDSIFQWLWNE